MLVMSVPAPPATPGRAPGPEPEDKAIRLGHPSYVWRAGQSRRLKLIRQFVALEGKRILDVGCGIGAYIERFREFSPDVYGIDIDFEKVARARDRGRAALVSAAETLPFRDEAFDVIFLHEVIEHVQDDRRTIAEACRILRVGGHLVIYAPNRLYFFETHGFYLGKRYVFRLVPFINWLPNIIRNRLVPHARAYRKRDFRKLFRGLPLQPVVHTYVYPGFDNIAARSPRRAALLRRALYYAENTPARSFGLSHFVVMRKA
jgi:SAM-dependent methyltransferase